jgi:hypothetical protein
LIVQILYNGLLHPLKKMATSKPIFYRKEIFKYLKQLYLKIMNFSNQFGLFPTQRNILTRYVCLLKNNVNTFKVQKKIEVSPYNLITLPYRISF